VTIFQILTDAGPLRRAAGIASLLLPLLSLPARAETSAPFFGYFISVGQPYVSPGGGGVVPIVGRAPGLPGGPRPRVAPATPRLLRGQHGPQAHDSSVSGPGYVINCYSGDGTIPDFAANSFLGESLLSSCTEGSSFSQPVNLNSGGDPAGTGTGNISGSITSMSFSLNVGPAAYLDTTQVLAYFEYIQVFDSPVPPGSQLTFSYTVSSNMPNLAGVFVSSDCDDPDPIDCTVTSINGNQNINTVTIGPSATYTVTAVIAFSAVPESIIGGIGYPAYSATINLGCALQAIPTPASGQIPALGLPGNNWALNYAIGGTDGLEITGVKLGNRSMAAKMSVPYVNVTTSDFSANDCQLQADGSGNCASKLVFFQSGTNDVTAIYVLTNIPEGTSSCLAVTENFEFDPPAAGDLCEPSGNIGCARFYPTTQYQYLPDEDSKSVTEVDIPMRIQFADGEPGSNLLSANQGQYAAIGTDDNVTGLENFFDRNPVEKEVFIPNVINKGGPGAADDYYQTYLKQIDSPAPGVTGPVPDCPTCVQIHWRWPKMFASVPGFGDDNGGEPNIPPGSTQSVDVALVAYPDNQQDLCSNLASGQQLAGNPSVFWYCGKGNQDSDTFFQHGGFFNPLSGTLTSPDITVTKGGFRINHANGEWGQTVTLTNNGGAVTGPLALVLDSLTSGVTLVNADGVTSNITPKGTPYVFAPLDSSSQLGPGQSLTVTLEFLNPKNGAITYSAEVYAGGLL
jgi:hypothetical protein